MRTIRIFRKLAAAAAIAASTGLASAPASAQKEVKVAVVVPLSGPWARNGELHVKGAQLAVDDINAAGGIKALGGAKIKLIVTDAGDSTEKAKNAAQRLVSQEPDLVGGTGAFVSSFTLAVTEITERAEVPFLTLSYSDQITNRGYKYVFQTSPTANKQSESALPVILDVAKAANAPRPKTIGILMDNTASPVSFTKPMREGGFDKLGLKLVVDEIFTPPLSDATSLVQKVRNARPDMLLVLTTNVPDTKLILEKLNEMGLGKGRLPVVTNGGPMGAPEMLKLVGKDLLEGVLVIDRQLGRQGPGEADRRLQVESEGAVAVAGQHLDLRRHLDLQGRDGEGGLRRSEEGRRGDPRDEHGDGAARYFPGQPLKFEANGRRAGAELVILQWQNGEPKAVYPASLATSQAAWPKR